MKSSPRWISRGLVRPLWPATTSPHSGYSGYSAAGVSRCGPALVGTLVLLLSACGADPAPATTHLGVDTAAADGLALSDVAGLDLGPGPVADTSPDTAADAVTDTAADAVADTSADTAADTAADAIADTVMDTDTDTAPDVVTDTAVLTDTVADTAPDVVTDTAVVTDTVADTAPDTAPDTTTDTVPDTATDTAAWTDPDTTGSAAPPVLDRYVRVPPADADAVLAMVAGDPTYDALDLADLRILFDDGVRAVYASPPLPGAQAPIYVLTKTPGDPVYAATVRWTVDAWDTQTDTDAEAVLAPSGARYHLAALGGFPAGTALELAVHLIGDGGVWDEWVNNGGANYALSVLAPAPLEWVGASALWDDGLPVPLSSDGSGPAWTGHDLTLTVRTYPPSPDQTVTLQALVDGQPVTVPCHFDFDGAGALGHDVQWFAVLQAADLAGATSLSLSVGASDGAGNSFTDPAGAGYYDLALDDPNAAFPISWSELGWYTFTKCHWEGDTCDMGWFYGAPVDDPLIVSHSVYETYSSWPYPALELYAAGLTDATADPGVQRAIGQHFLRVQVVSPVFAGSPSDAPEVRDLPWFEQAGNNFRYRWTFLRPGTPEPLVGMSWPDNAVYPYYFQVSVDGGATWQRFPPDSDLTLDWQMSP